ncbi:MAG: alpha/beta hydrolase [Amphritea sp.]|nr:alpha/beta hydrolase [Amphritea sp.]
MASAYVNGVDIEYEVYGEHNITSLLMIQGLSMQLIDWPSSLIEELSKHFKVIVFDNRDVGFSSKVESNQCFNYLDMNVGFFSQNVRYSSYSLYDMANDAICLIDYLGIKVFHVLGFSMGGMIAQIVAANHPDRVLTLVSLLSSGGQEEIKPRLSAKLAMEQSATDIGTGAMIQSLLDAVYVYAGPNHQIVRSVQRSFIERSVQRSYCPEGVYRQGLAMRSSGDRQALLRKIKAPALIIHGTDDPCIPIDQSLRAAELIRHSTLCVIKGLGHDFPEDLIPYIAGKIITHCDH